MIGERCWHSPEFRSCRDDTVERLAARVLEVEHRLLPAAVLAAAAAGHPVPLEESASRESRVTSASSDSQFRIGRQFVTQRLTTSDS